MAPLPEEKISEEDLFKFWLRPHLRPAGPPPHPDLMAFQVLNLLFSL
jgi:hypothetical protein